MLPSKQVNAHITVDMIGRLLILVRPDLIPFSITDRWTFTSWTSVKVSRFSSITGRSLEITVSVALPPGRSRPLQLRANVTGSIHWLHVHASHPVSIRDSGVQSAL